VTYSYRSLNWFFFFFAIDQAKPGRVCPSLPLDSMDLQTLSQLFATTYNADPNIRKAAELQIRKVSVLSFILFFISAGEYGRPTGCRCGQNRQLHLLLLLIA
jgi:hypothetical protein